MTTPSLPAPTALLARLAGLACALALLAGCGGAQSAAVPPHVRAPIGASSAARLTITIPHATNANSAQRRPQYISPATQALAVTITGPTSLSEGINLTTGNPSCTVNLYSNLVCTVSLALAPCPSNTACYTGTFTTYDQAYTNASGGSCSLSSCTQPAGTKALSQAQSVSFLVAAGAANNLPITLGGVPATVAVLSSATTISGNALTGFVLPMAQSGQVSVLGVDADGNYILGPGAPAVALTTSDATQFTVTPIGTSAPNLFTVANASSNPAGALLTATVTPTTASGASPLTAAADIFSGSATLYVTNLGNSTVTAYDAQGTQQTLTGTFPNLNGPYGIAYDPANGWLYVANNGNSTVTAYNAQGAQQTLTGTFPSLSSPAGIAYDPANGWLYVANPGNNTVTAYNAQGAKQTLTGTFPNLNGPGAIAYDPANGWLYVANLNNNTMTAYNAQGAQQTLTSGSFPNLSNVQGIAYDPANGWLCVTNGNNTVTAYNAQGAQQTLASGSFPNFNGPVGIAYDPANGWLYVANSGNYTVTVYNAQGTQQTPTGTFPNLSGPYGIAVVP